ncbi:RNA 2',3'-cyclic phosphodiesterase [Alkalibacterium iburiense]|uniref:RNA 2',3'-cyclic phosphodiesterase n=1 Tax=Alkalibacterium iburiense TaxID=290589 RepID=A0ABN0X0Q8_9LACT
MMRVFIAIELSKDIKEELKQTQDKLSPFCTKGRLTDKSNFHLTLRFIGEVNLKEYHSLKKAVDTVMKTHYPFSLHLDSLGSFNKRNRHIIWAGVRGEMNKLYNLYYGLEEALLEEGFPKEEREYTPHITLARQVQLIEPINELNQKVSMKSLEFSVKDIAVMESINRNGQLVYRPVYRGERSSE